MSKQNIYDNETFFEGYKGIRDKKVNANDIFEIPVLMSLLPDLNDKSVIDLGCGFGEHCKEYVRRGASKVVGIDISKKMLEVAEAENSDPKIEYLLMPMEDIDQLHEKFDVVISSLAFHYVEDFNRLIRNIYIILNNNGTFIYSQENPLSTCYAGSEDRWTRDENGKKLYYNLSNYNVEGVRESKWFVEGVQKYHRKFSTIVNTLVTEGFIIENMIEPGPTEEILEQYPNYYDLKHKPDFLILKAKKR